MTIQGAVETGSENLLVHPGEIFEEKEIQAKIPIDDWEKIWLPAKKVLATTLVLFPQSRLVLFGSAAHRLIAAVVQSRLDVEEKDLENKLSPADYSDLDFILEISGDEESALKDQQILDLAENLKKIFSEAKTEIFFPLTHNVQWPRIEVEQNGLWVSIVFGEISSMRLVPFKHQGVGDPRISETDNFTCEIPVVREGTRYRIRMEWQNEQIRAEQPGVSLPERAEDGWSRNLHLEQLVKEDEEEEWRDITSELKSERGQLIINKAVRAICGWQKGFNWSKNQEAKYAVLVLGETGDELGTHLTY